ncbi:hypothetical protein R2362_20220 [Mycobacteroides chelonae]|nr:hypothetical protein [Mycobacteroides chelonae]
MKRNIARALRRVANWLEPPKTHVVVNAVYVAAQERQAKARRNLLQAEQRLAEARVASAGRIAAEAFEKSWATKILDGIAAAAPALPNMANARKAPWWRRLLRRFGR